jgi:hypothetical protein
MSGGAFVSASACEASSVDEYTVWKALFNSGVTASSKYELTEGNNDGVMIPLKNDYISVSADRLPEFVEMLLMAANGQKVRVQKSGKNFTISRKDARISLRELSYLDTYGTGLSYLDDGLRQLDRVLSKSRGLSNLDIRAFKKKFAAKKK